MKRQLVLAGLIFLASAQLAWAAAPADPPPPQGPDRDQIDKWVDDYIARGDDVEAATTEMMVLFYDPASVKVTSRGVQSVVHGEQYVTQLIGPGPIRSFRDVWLFDCAGRRFQLVESQIYAKSNLQGPALQLDTSNERWSQSFVEGVGPGSLIARVCMEAKVPVGGAELPPRDAL